MPNETAVFALIGSLALAVIGVVVPLTQVITTYLSNKTIAALTQTVGEQGAVIKGLMEDRDHLPERVAQEIANNALLTAYAIELRKALTAADVPPSEQPPQPALQSLTQLTPGATQAVEAVQDSASLVPPQTVPPPPIAAPVDPPVIIPTEVVKPSE